MRKFTLFLMSLFLSVGAMAQNYKIGQTVTDVTTGYYVVVGTFNANTTGPVYYDNGQSPKYRLDRAKTINANSTLTDGNYVWYVENNGTTITLKNVQDDVYFVKDAAKNHNFDGTETANLYLEKVVKDDANDKRYYLHLEDQNIGYIHCNQPQGQDPCLSYWNASGESGTCVRFEFYEVSVDIEYPHNTGNINRNDRGLRAFTITDGENSLTVSDIQTTNTAPVYVDKSAQKFTTTAGSTLEFSEFNWDGWAMHAYAFVDYNKDYTFNSTANNNGEGDGEVVSYNYYDGNDITGADNAEGNTQNKLTYGTSKGMPAFTLPADLEPGEYRLRVKIDWNNLDGNYGASDIAGNGGCQCDITLVVEESAANSEAKADLKAAIEELDEFLASISVGNCITQYSTSIDSPEAQIEGVKNFYKTINSETTIQSIEECTAAVREIKESYKENVLEDGKFYHIRSVVYENGYVYASLSDEIPTDDREERNGILWKATTTPSNTAIWKCEIINDVIYFKNIYTASYMNGLRSQSPGALSETEKAPITLTALGDGQVNFMVNGKQAHAQNYAPYHNFVPWPGEKGSASAWYIEEATAGVQPHTLTVGAAGYATLMLGYNTTIPAIDGEDCGVFVATVEGEYAVLNEINGVLPANTAVIVKAASGTYNFDYATGEATAIENNDLRGTLYDKNIAEAAYVLGKDENNVAYLGLAKMTDGVWKNNANKAYLPMPAGAQGIKSYSLRFEGEGTTGINEVKGENGNVKTIYDLTGRRVEAITAPGIYIVNGKKTLVK